MHARRFHLHDGAEAFPVFAGPTACAFDGLMICPVPVAATALMPGVGLFSELYRIAFEEAAATVRSLRFERRSRVFPN